MTLKTEDELEHQFKTEHFEELRFFTRTLLATATGSLGLIAGLHGKTAVAVPTLPFRAGWVLLCMSALVGFVVQWQIVMAPLHHWARAKRLADQARQTGSAEPLQIRRVPLRGHAKLIAAQAIAFAAAVVCLTWAILG